MEEEEEEQEGEEREGEEGEEENGRSRDVLSCVHFAFGKGSVKLCVKSLSELRLNLHKTVSEHTHVQLISFLSLLNYQICFLYKFPTVN